MNNSVIIDGDHDWVGNRFHGQRLENRHYGPWIFDWEYTTYPTYPQPNPFELMEGPNQPRVADSEGRKDGFDISIDYTAARNRVRKGFEWDMDRLFLAEELATRR